MENQEALLLKKEIGRLEKRRDKLDNEISFKFQRLQLICIHNETKIKDEHVSGGYLNRAEYIKKRVCTVCEKVLSEATSYGGFE